MYLAGLLELVSSIHGCLRIGVNHIQEGIGCVQSPICQDKGPVDNFNRFIS